MPFDDMEMACCGKSQEIGQILNIILRPNTSSNKPIKKDSFEISPISWTQYIKHHNGSFRVTRDRRYSKVFYLNITAH